MKFTDCYVGTDAQTARTLDDVCITLSQTEWRQSTDGKTHWLVIPENQPGFELAMITQTNDGFVWFVPEYAWPENEAEGSAPTLDEAQLSVIHALPGSLACLV